MWTSVDDTMRASSASTVATRTAPTPAAAPEATTWGRTAGHVTTSTSASWATAISANTAVPTSQGRMSALAVRGTHWRAAGSVATLMSAGQDLPTATLCQGHDVATPWARITVPATMVSGLTVVAEYVRVSAILVVQWNLC